MSLNRSLEKCFTRSRKCKSKQDMYTNSRNLYRLKQRKKWTKWKTKKLTIFGKVCVLNSLARPKFLYTGSILNHILKKYRVFYITLFRIKREDQKKYWDRKNSRWRHRYCWYTHETYINKSVLDKSHLQKKQFPIIFCRQSV